MEGGGQVESSQSLEREKDGDEGGERSDGSNDDDDDNSYHRWPGNFLRYFSPPTHQAGPITRRAVGWQG